MRKTTLIMALTAAGGLLLPATFGWTASAKQLNVQVQKAELRASPSPLGAVVGTAAYGDSLEVVEEKGAWIKVSLPGGTGSGWVHSSALTRQKIRLQAGEQDADVRASSGEQALAGKGFNKDVEAAFRAKNKDVDFSWVDKMLGFKVSPQTMEAFLKEGHLKTPQGGAQ